LGDRVGRYGGGKDRGEEGSKGGREAHVDWRGGGRVFKTRRKVKRWNES
jgi:hypothetical protein